MTHQPKSAETHHRIEFFDGARGPETIPPLYEDVEVPSATEIEGLAGLSPERQQEMVLRLQEARRRDLSHHFGSVINVGMEGN